MNKPHVDWDVSLELLCADDFGAGRMVSRTKEDTAHLKNYVATRAKHQQLESLFAGTSVVVDVWDANDKYSDHSDAYLRFQLSHLPLVIENLKQIGLTPDILDVPEDFPRELALCLVDCYNFTVSIGPGDEVTFVEALAWKKGTAGT